MNFSIVRYYVNQFCSIITLEPQRKTRRGSQNALNQDKTITKGVKFYTETDDESIVILVDSYKTKMQASMDHNIPLLLSSLFALFIEQ